MLSEYREKAIWSFFGEISDTFNVDLLYLKLDAIFYKCVFIAIQILIIENIKIWHSSSFKQRRVEINVYWGITPVTFHTECVHVISFSLHRNPWGV